MPAIVFDHVSKSYSPHSAPAVEDVSLTVEAGTFNVLLGPSGCGKTTLLKMVNRLHEPTSGRIFLNGVNIHTLPLNDLRRQIGYVIQQVGLFPHMTVAQNIAVVPELLHWPAERIAERRAELLDLVHLPAEFQKRYPGQLSGGQQQRIGLARALAADPQVMLMDEPFGAIDAITRTSLQDQLLELQRRLKKTILFVTHDVEEALKLADQIIIFDQGRLVQMDSPCGLLAHPVNDFVRQLLNTEDRIRHLSVLRAEAVMLPVDGGTDDTRPQVALDESLRQVLSYLLEPGVSTVYVHNSQEIVGQIRFEQLRQAGCEDGPA